MKLKQLEIIGFKSFMDRTVISFEKDITVVVGPNGCGKSNIIDAIRWVMGEQSAKHLRGKSMEDVIFNGSENRPQLSMASVELTFSTEGYQTPPQYANHPEISICRRLYRDGQSEYLINKSQARLKDITDLFLGTGVGTKAYSIIEQGKVNQFIMAKPEERRYYIEEVAGISRFKARKEQALRKIEATQQNLLRLTDLLTELDRQQKSLDRQAKKAEKFREVKTEFEKWDLALSSTQYGEFLNRQGELETNLRTLGEEEQNLQVELNQAENGFEDLRFDLSSRERDIQDVQNQTFEFNNLTRLYEATLQFKSEEIKRVARDTENGLEQCRRDEARIAEIKDRMLVVSDDVLENELEHESLRSQVDEINARALELQSRFQNDSKMMDELREAIQSGESRLVQIETLRQSYLQKKDDLVRRVTRDDEELAKSSKHLRELEKVYGDTDSSLAGLKQLKLDLTVRTGALTEELARHRDNLKNLEGDLSKLKEDLTLRKSRLSSLEELQKNFEGYHEGTRSVLLKKRQEGFDGVLGTVADFVETEPEYEGAVSAVLGEKMQYVLVKSQEAGVEAVDYLRTMAKGRSSFIPMEIQSTAQNVATQVYARNNEEGIFGPLKEFVSLRNEQKNLSQFLFGDVVLVKDLRKALDIWSKGEQKPTLVTLDGEMVDPSGMITGGSTENASLAILEKKREMKDLSSLIEILQSQLIEKEDTRRTLQHSIASLEFSLDSVKNSSFEEGVRIASQEKEVEQFRREMDQIRKNQSQLSERIREERDSLQELEPELAKFDLEERELRAQTHVKRDDLIARREDFEKCRLENERISQELTSVKVAFVQSQEKLSRFASELDRLDKEMSQVILRLFENRASIEMSQARAESMEGEIKHLTRVLDKKLLRSQELQQKLSLLRQQYDEASSKVRDEEFKQKNLRGIISGLTQNINQITVSLTEVRGQMKHLSEQCLERHQRDLAAIYQEYFNAELNREEAIELVAELKDRLIKMGDVNTGALTEFEEISKRFEFIKKQKDDLENSLSTLERVIHKINSTTKDRFEQTFHLVNEKFQELFPKLFQGGGKASLQMTDPANILETGIEVIAQPPGKKLQSINLLSGGEKALTAVSLIFAIFQIKPSPFCILDEVDAPLDDVNVSRFNDMLREMTHKTQFVVITHNKKTMAMGDVLYGVTMQEPGVSQLVSVAMN